MALEKNLISPKTSSPSSARLWEERISNVFKKESEIHFDHLPPLCVFQVPKLLIHQNPQAYTPQLVGMGPYHHLMPELYHMERYKLAAIKQILDPSQILNFQHIVVDKLKQMDPMIRACYSRFMDLQEGTLAWIIAIDGLFLIHVLHTLLSSYDVQGGCLSGDNILTRDIILLENQIPVILLNEILNLVELSSPFDEVFWMLLRFCEAHSPLKISMESRNFFNDSRQPLHLLDLMYHLIVKDKSPESCVEVPIQEIQKGSPETKLIVNEEDDDQDQDMFENFEEIIDFVETLGPKPTQKIIKPVKDVKNVIPWTTISGLFRTATKIDGDDEDEITFPSVASLWRYARVKCSPILQGGSICNIEFDEHEAALYLPVITLNSCSEVILRNLVAYEASMLKSTLEFARYVNLMNGIVDTAEDVRMLRQNGVIKGTSTLSDQETADLFNGMKRFFIKADKRSNIEVAIKKVNEYYDRRMVVRLYRRMKKNADVSWKILAFVSFILTLAMLALQTFCESFSCSRFWGPK
ncbi:PREDICTED: putative UPF0481 protein At3g02645 [Ipomoea nil]|uniref:putative UPF0481 protein At3g02645 n=1 Tax=Ipomoea nil TaxID=35883 RepID=UPI000901B23B|nr:PREDICTED: putative UPF0481 protein At3g02645 [Ipomoea nil]